MRTTEGTSEAFEVKTGVRQGCILSPLLFNCFLDRIVKDVLSVLGGGFHVEYSTGGGLFLSYRDKTPASAHIQDAMYADDMALVAESRSEMQHMVKALDKACERWGMHISVDKTKIVAVGEQEPDHSPISIQGQALEEVESFPYLGGEVGEGGDCEAEEGKHYISDTKAQDFQKPKPEQINQRMGIQNNGDVYPPLWCRDKSCDTEGNS